MEKKDKRAIGYIVLAAVLLLAVLHPELIVSVFGYLTDMIMPVVVGFIIAFIMNVPVAGFEKLLNRLFGKKKPHKKLFHGLSIVLSVVSVLVVLTVLSVLVIPEVVRTVNSIITLVENQWPHWLAILESYHINTENLRVWLSDINWNSLLTEASGYAGSLIGSVAGMASSTVSVMWLALSGSVIAIYMLIDRDKLAVQVKKLLNTYTKPKFSSRAVHIGGMIKRAYTRFLTGQCLDALLLGVSIFIVFSVIGLPYPALIAVVTTICALVPYIGAFVSCVLAVLLSLVVSPTKALICLIVYLIIQFIESQIIYPRVVGGSVGLSPLWTLVAVIVGGQLFGLVGMVFFIPLVSVAYDLIKEHVETREKRKDTAVEGTPPSPTE